MKVFLKAVTKVLLVGVAVSAMSLSASADEVTQASIARPASSVEWVGFAVAPNGRVFKSDPVQREGVARNSANDECAQATLRSCAAIAVFASTDVIAVSCSSGRKTGGYIGGSNIDMGAARWLAFDKAKKAGFDESDCSIVFTY